MQEKASVQLLHQEGDLPSGSMPSVPPPVAPKGTWPQQGGRPKTFHRDPTRLVAKFHSAGWKKDLEHFMAWIKQGSYYHGLVAQQGHLHKCPHVVGLPLPRQPQVTLSESCWESQMKAEATATSSNKPSVGATVAPVAETPVMETPVTQTPVVETPATCSDTPAPMETGRAGDGQSWAE